MTNEKDPAGSEARVNSNPSGHSKGDHKEKLSDAARKAQQNASNGRGTSAASTTGPNKDRSPSDRQQGAKSEHGHAEKGQKSQGSSGKSRPAGR